MALFVLPAIIFYGIMFIFILINNIAQKAGLNGIDRTINIIGVIYSSIVLTLVMPVVLIFIGAGTLMKYHWHPAYIAVYVIIFLVIEAPALSALFFAMHL